MRNKTDYVFYGDPTKQTEKRRPDSPTKAEPYIASEELITAVNLAISLNRPLLLEGEAGCGKTRLARAVAYELDLPLYTWHVRSTSKAQEGLYSYDAILRLHDVQTLSLGSPEGDIILSSEAGEPTLRNPQNAKDYRRFGPLGRAFNRQDYPAVVLIDEIDKADIDFPNDLLAVLDDPWQFEIPETGEVITASEDFRPIVIITSNKEKGNLPAPFLRRCVYYFVDFPDSEDLLKRIVDAHYRLQDSNAPDPDLIDASVSSFLAIRKEWGLYKNPGTSEFLDWLEALREKEVPSPDVLTLAADHSALSFPQLLIKLRADWQRHVSATK